MAIDSSFNDSSYHPQLDRPTDHQLLLATRGLPVWCAGQRAQFGRFALCARGQQLHNSTTRGLDLFWPGVPPHDSDAETVVRGRQDWSRQGLVVGRHILAAGELVLQTGIPFP